MNRVGHGRIRSMKFKPIPCVALTMLTLATPMVPNSLMLHISIDLDHNVMKKKCYHWHCPKERKIEIREEREKEKA